jgi:hypothetical protein
MNIFHILLGRELATYIGAFIRYSYLRIRGEKVKFSKILNGKKMDHEIDKMFNSAANYYTALIIGLIILITIGVYNKYFMTQ